MTSLLHLTDFHFWSLLRNPVRMLNKRALGNANLYARRRHHFPMRSAELFLEHIESTGIRTLFLGGDFTTTALDEEFAMAAGWVRQLAREGCTAYAVPGNHDVYTFEAIRARRYERYLGEWTPGGGLPSRVDLPGGAPMVFAPTVCPNFLSSRGRIRRGEIERVRELVAGCENSTVLVGGHYPVLERGPGFNTPWARRLDGAAGLRQALGESGKQVLYLCGHAHKFGYLRDPIFPSLTHLCTGALFLHRKGTAERGTFSEVHVKEEAVEVYLHRCTDQWTRERVEPRVI